ncbi:MAG TPA: hypothetical protein VMD31_14965 [Opitutaceae bacterium]|nr:hypothetical protein [Opitutaceae bacterium]
MLAAALLGAVVLAFWLVGPLSLRGTATREPEGYYGLLTEAFLRGHTYLSIQPDPALAALPNPWAGYQGVPRLHDATYFHGRYYLYFGPTPAIILGVPWRLLTGTYLSDGAMTFVFTAAGALLGGGLLLGAWRRWFFPLSRVWLAAALLAVTCSGYVFCLVESNAVYPVPIACAYACLMAALAGIALVLRRPTGPAAALGLGAASLCWGLAVAARPDYAFSLPVLALPVAYAAKESTRLGRARFRGAAAVLCAGVLPALLVGVAVALYNFARFGDLMEFGWKYQFASVDQRFTRLLALGHLADNWRGYLLATPLYSPYFPFVLENEGAWGILRCCPLALAALAFPLTLGVPALRRDPSWLWLGVAALAAALLNFFSLGLLSIAAERYLVDAVPLALWLGVMVTLGFLQHTCRSPQWLVRLGAATAAALLLGCTLVHTVLFAFDHYGRPERLAPLARLLDQPAAAWERMRGIRHGPIEMKVQFGQIQPGRNDPLLVTGGGRDVLLATYPSDHEVQFSFQHAGDGGPVSDRFPIKPGETHLLEADLGSLYPPNEHPFFRGWPDHLVDRLRHRVWVVFDGHQALDTGSRFYRTNPWDLHLGFNPYGWATAPRFSGRIVQIEQTARLAEQPPAVPPGQGAVRLTVRLPAFRAFHSEPLISTGIPGAGDLLYVTYVGPGQLRFAHDHWGAGAVESPAAPYDANALHVVDVDMASLHPGVGSGNRTGLLAVRFDGRLLLDQDRPFYASDPGDVVVGFNNTASTAAVSIFSGQIARVDRVASALASQQPRTPGALRLQLRLPVDRPGRSEPLVVTGRTGAGDGVFVRYLDHNHVSFGYDHWGVGGAVTPPVEVDYGAILDLEIGLASLYPPAGDPDWAGVAEATKQAAMTRIWVTLDGRTVFSATAKSYPAPADEVFVGRNPIGLSTCDPDFSGAILIQERLPIGIPPAAP